MSRRHLLAAAVSLVATTSACRHDLNDPNNAENNQQPINIDLNADNTAQSGDDGLNSIGQTDDSAVIDPNNPDAVVGNDENAANAKKRYILVFQPEGETTFFSTSEDSLAADAFAVTQMRQNLLDNLHRDFGVELEIIKQYEHIPAVAVTASDADMEAIRAEVGDEGVFAEQFYEHTLAESRSLIRQPQAAQQGFDGRGTAVAVLDTGTDFTRTAFGSCQSAGGSCKVAAALDFADDDRSLDDDGHGTNVAGIVLGVAPATKILALDVFSAGGGASNVDIVAAIDWVIANKARYNIVAMNMSLGSGGSTGPCSRSVFASAIDRAQRAGVISVVASGNEGFIDRIAEPACVPSAVSVGAVYDGNLGRMDFGDCTDRTTSSDQVTCFSNSASFLTILAPGSEITAAGISMSGTSQASPHVAGAVAALRSGFTGETSSQIISRLTRGGISVVDRRNGVATPRLDLVGAINALGNQQPSNPANPSPQPNPPAGSGPTGSISIVGATNVGGTPAVNSNQVNLALSAQDSSGAAVNAVCLSDTTSCNSFISFTNNVTATFPAGDGRKTIYATFRNSNGVTGPAASLAFIIDTTAPSNGSATATAGNARVDLAWNGFADATTNVASYRVVSATGSAPASCGAGNLVYAGGNNSVAHTGLSNGTPVFYRICAVDGAGNVSSGITASAVPQAPASQPNTGPTSELDGKMIINAGARYTNSRVVEIVLQPNNPSKVTKFCLTASGNCNQWFPISGSIQAELSGDDGTKTITALFADARGNVSATPATASITLDTQVPADGVLTLQSQNGVLFFIWGEGGQNGFRDASGIAQYRLVGTTDGNAPASCEEGNVLYEGPRATLQQNQFARNTTYSYRLCAIDNAGNMSAGDDASAIVQ